MGLKIMQKSSKSLNWFNCILILSVIVVLATNGAVLFYTSSEVSRASDMSIPIILGNIAKAFNGVSISARSIYVLTVFSPNTNISMYQNSILDDVEILKEIRVEILNNLDT